MVLVDQSVYVQSINYWQLVDPPVKLLEYFHYHLQLKLRTRFSYANEPDLDVVVQMEDPEPTVLEKPMGLIR